MSTASYAVDCVCGIFKKTVQIVFVSRIGNINQMIRYFAIFVQILACAYRHAAVHLPRVSAYYLSVNGSGQTDRTACLARCSRADNSDERHVGRGIVMAHIAYRYIVILQDLWLFYAKACADGRMACPH